MYMCVQVTFNIGGYFLAPVLSGFVMQATDSLEWGFRVILYWGAFALISMFLSYRYGVRMHVYMVVLFRA